MISQIDRQQTLKKSLINTTSHFHLLSNNDLKKCQTFLFEFDGLFCIKRQSKKQSDSSENIQMYSKFGGETSAYSEISENNQNGKVSS